MLLPAHQRIHALDILRGFALLGMFIVHFHMRSTEPGGFEDLVRTFIWRLVESKSHGTFALLFGAGFAIQLGRAGARGGSFARLYLRRLAVLAAFGFVAHAFFGYNVLLSYAVWGVPLLLIRSWSTRALVLVAALGAVSVSLYHFAATSYVLLERGPDAVAQLVEANRAEATEVTAALRAAEARGSYPALLAARLRHMEWFYTQPFFFMPSATLSLFVVGFLLVRHRVFEQPGAHVRLLGAMAAFGVVSWTADNWLLPSWNLRSFGLLRDQWLTFAYVGGVLALLARRSDVADRLGAVGNAGRMALTNYLLQIAALDLVFSSYGFGLQEVRPVVALTAALACFAIEAAVSTIWLKHFQFGPAEWVWRSLTYGRLQPMRRAVRPMAPVSI